MALTSSVPRYAVVSTILASSKRITQQQDCSYAVPFLASDESDVEVPALLNPGIVALLDAAMPERHRIVRNQALVALEAGCR